MGERRPKWKKPPKRERSAGVVLFRRDASTGERLYLLLDYGRHWDFPKGHVEKGEDDRAAALREVREESGIEDVTLTDGFTHQIVYFFQKPGGRLVRKTVVFFIGETPTQDVVISDEHVGFEWLGREAALTRLKYPTAKQVFRAASRFLHDWPAPAPGRPGA